MTGQPDPGPAREIGESLVVASDHVEGRVGHPLAQRREHLVGQESRRVDVRRVREVPDEEDTRVTRCCGHDFRETDGIRDGLDRGQAVARRQRRCLHRRRGDDHIGVREPDPRQPAVGVGLGGIAPIPKELLVVIVEIDDHVRRVQTARQGDADRRQVRTQRHDRGRARALEAERRLGRSRERRRHRSGEFGQWRRAREPLPHHGIGQLGHDGVGRQLPFGLHDRDARSAGSCPLERRGRARYGDHDDMDRRVR